MRFSRRSADVGALRFVNAGNFSDAIRLGDVSINSDTHIGLNSSQGVIGEARWLSTTPNTAVEPEDGYVGIYEPVSIAVDPNEWSADDVANVVISSFQDISHRTSKKESGEQKSLSEEAMNKWEELIREKS